MFNWTKAEAIILPIALLVTIILATIICLITKNKTAKIKNVPLMVISITLLIMEIIKQIYNIVIGYNTWCIPLHFCSLFMYFYPFVFFTNNDISCDNIFFNYILYQPNFSNRTFMFKCICKLF